MMNQKAKAYLKHLRNNPEKVYDKIDYLYGELKDYLKVIKELGIDKDSVVFDVGIGNGTFLVNLIWQAKCKGIGVEPVKTRYEKAKAYRDKWNLTDKLELHNEHYPCEIEMKPTHVILHACAFKKTTALEIYKALPKGVKILHNSRWIREYAHPKDTNVINIKSSYMKKIGSRFYIHEK